MRSSLQYILSAIFICQMYLAMLVLAIWYTPFVLFRRDAAFDAVHTYTPVSYTHLDVYKRQARRLLRPPDA